jgi:5-bromo-4-chloroindolyl phosphate hydrolysis protein
MESIKKYQSVIPSEAFVTKNNREVCRMIGERLVDIKHKIRYLVEKVECERTILRTKSEELTERDKKIIRDYINRLEQDIEKWTKVRNRLHKLANSENRLQKVFTNRKIVSNL